MIRFCSCSKDSPSPLENPKQQESLKSCKICGGRVLVDGRGAQQGSMLSNGGLELSRVIDPHLSWKTASNGRQRAVRRARTSFIGANRKNSPAKALKVSNDLNSKDSKDIKDIPVSESEKVGVSILGRRFSDTLGSVPIKKRRFLLAHSPSPPSHSSSYSDDAGHIQERKIASNQGATLKQHSFDTNSISGSVLSQEGNFGFKKTDLKGVNDKVCDAADFSGISILAAAACDSNIDCSEFMNDDGSLPKEPSSEVQGVTKESAKIDFLPHDKEEAVPQISEDLVGRTDLPFELSSSSVLPSKESNEVKSDGSSNLDTSADSFQNVQKTTESLSRDVRFHWDLNTVADAWEVHESLNSDQEIVDNLNKDGDQKEKLGIVETFMDQVGFGDTKNVPIGDSQIFDARDYVAGGENEVIHSSERKFEEKPDISTDISAADKESKHFISNNGDIPANRDISCSIGDFPSTIRGTVVSDSAVVDSLLSSNGILEDMKAEAGKAEAHLVDFHPKVEAENSSCCLVSHDNTIFGHPPGVSGLTPGMDGKLIESRTVQMAEIDQTRSYQAEKHELPPAASGTIKANETSMVSCLSEKCSEVQAHRNIHDSLVTGCVNSGAIADMNFVDETGCHSANKSKEKYGYEYETTAVEMTMDNTDAHNDDMDDERNGFPTSIGFTVSDGKSVGIISGNIEASLPFSSRGDLGSASNSTQVSVENHLDKQCYPDASQTDHDQDPGMEKVEFLGDDDSQYEDGELRESLANCWLDDGEEGETEHVDYGSDRDTYFCDAASDFCSVNRQVNNMGISDTSQDIQHREVGKGTHNTSRPFMNCSSLANVSDDGMGKCNAGNAMGTGLPANRAAGNDVGDNGGFKEADDARRSNHSASFRKMSGWDRLPGGYRGSGNGMTDSRSDSIARNHNGSSSGPSRVGDSMNRAVGSSLRRDSSSRGDRVQSSDMLHRNDKSYGRTSRSDDRNGFNSRVDRDRDDPRSIGRVGPSMHLQGRGRGDRWVDSSYHGNNRHDSSGYYGSANFSNQGSRNAAAAAVAKVESNGFVVAPDGTIVKAGAPGSAEHLTRRSVKGPSQNPHCSHMGRGSPVERERSFGRPSGPGRSREMSPDRPLFAGRVKPGGYGPRMDGVSHRERYRGPMPDGIIDSVSMHHTTSRRDRSFSPPHRKPLHLSRSHSRSPSRSRTRSPHRWASPRGRSDNGMNGGPGLRQRSISPNLKSDARMGRPRAGFGEHIVSYSSLCRNHTSPPHASRWIDRRKDASEHFRDYEYRRGLGRSPPARVLSRGRRFDLMDSPGRLNPDEYGRPTNSGRFHGFVGFGRGSKHDGKGDDRREHGDRYEMLHPARRYVNEVNMKRLRYDEETGVMAPSPQPKPKSLAFQRRESPRAFDRGTDRQPGDSPRRYKEDKGHLRNSGDGNHNANCKSFGIPDGGDHMDIQRRPQ